MIICESTKEASKLLRHHGVTGKTFEVLDEHSQQIDLAALVKIVKAQKCALVSDCGTPGFCDPGADLIQQCRNKNIEVKIVPGPSAIAALLSVVGAKTSEFIFVGFIPAENEARDKKWKSLIIEKRPFILMDTPYRLTKILEELEKHCAQRNCVIVVDVSLETEQILEGKPSQLLDSLRGKKAEFMIWINPDQLKK